MQEPSNRFWKLIKVVTKKNTVSWNARKSTPNDSLISESSRVTKKNDMIYCILLIRGVAFKWCYSSTKSSSWREYDFWKDKKSPSLLHVDKFGDEDIPVSQSASLPVRQSVSQPVCQSASPPVCQSASQLAWCQCNVACGSSMIGKGSPCR